MGYRRLLAALLCLLAAAAELPSLGFAQSNRAPSTLADIGAFSAAGATAQRRAAQAGLAMLIARWATSRSGVGANRIFDIGDRRSLKSATIGDGFETYFVDPRMLLSGKPLSQSLYGSGEWRFVVMANGKGIGLVTVARMHDTWTMVEAGASGLAGEIADVAARYMLQSPGVRLRFIRSPQAVADFIEVAVPSRHPTNAPLYIPLESARVALAPFDAGPIEQASVLSETQLTAALRPRVQRGIRDPRIGH